MTNIPTDLLRTFVSVVELRSFTRSAKAQGMTQPAASAQIRRLQCLLAAELFDKSAPGVSLTPMGEQVLDFARRMLAINDQILEIASPDPTAQVVRIGMPSDCMGAELAQLLAVSHARWPERRFVVQGGGPRRLLQCLKQNEVDLVLGLVTDKPGDRARHYWVEELTWVRGESTKLDPDAPVPLISYKDTCTCYRVATAALHRIGRQFKLVFRANNAEALRSAVSAGLGVMVAPRSRIPAELAVWDDGPLPPVPPLYCAIFLSEGAGSEMLDQVADDLAETLRPPAVRSAATVFAAARSTRAEAARPSM